MSATRTTTWKVIVHFATSYAPRVVDEYDTEEAARRNAHYSDARGVWIESPTGERMEVSR